MFTDATTALGREIYQVQERHLVRLSPKHAIRVLKLDTMNRVRFGDAAPLYAERIYVETNRCEAIPRPKKVTLGWHARSSGKVLKHWPVQQSEIISPIALKKVRYCVDHWADGLTWEETGAYEFYERRGWNIDDIAARHKNLDSIFATVRSERRLRTKQELDPRHFRELDGIRISIGPSGQLIFCDSGTHRLAMAIVLGIRVIPAQIGCVYEGALKEVQRIRRRPQAGA